MIAWNEVIAWLPQSVCYKNNVVKTAFEKIPRSFGFQAITSYSRLFYNRSVVVWCDSLQRLMVLQETIAEVSREQLLRNRAYIQSFYECRDPLFNSSKIVPKN